jgi:hypothetical protein
MQMNHGIGAQIDRAIDKNKTNMVVYHIFSFITPIFHKMQQLMFCNSTCLQHKIFKHLDCGLFGCAVILHYILLFFIIFKIINIEKICFLKFCLDDFENLIQNWKKIIENLSRI